MVWKKGQGMPRRKEKGSLFQRIQKMEIKSRCRPSSLKAHVFLKVDRFPLPTPQVPFLTTHLLRGRRGHRVRGRVTKSRWVKSILKIGVGDRRGLED